MVYLFATLAFIGGLLMIIGGTRKWPWLIDPPDSAVFYHPMRDSEHTDGDRDTGQPLFREEDADERHRVRNF